MAGYIGSKAVILSTTAAEVAGDITSTDASPEITLQNTTEEDTDGGRESKITFKGEQSGGEITTLAQIQASHDGTSDDEKGDLIFSTNDGADGNTPTERLRIDADGNVGIGTTSPSSANSLNTVLSVNASTSEKAGISLSENDTNRFDVFFDGSDNSAHLYNSASGGMRFYGTGTERMRISASGRVGVGTDDPDDHTSAGVRLFDDGRSYSTVDGNFCFTANRLSSDGTLIRLQKDSTTVGSIGIQSSGFQIDGEPSHTGILFVANAWQPKYNGSTSDNFVDLGASSVRFDDIYATNGTIQTSDQNEKQQIASLTDAEITAAKAISKLFKTFKWNDAVTEKGDAARTHSGVIAQDVEQAMTDAGLNAGNYAFFISTTWWEADGEIYDTAEEAPESATERNRKGIRYPQLLSFIGAATEQRLASIESRLDALETA